MKVTSLILLFTALKGSTDQFERVGDLVAGDLVRAFRVLNEGLTVLEIFGEGRFREQGKARKRWLKVNLD